jgi:isocitrate dehydrogenase
MNAATAPNYETVFPLPKVPKIPVVLAEGDGIGPEILRATLRVLDAAGVALDPTWIRLGESVYREGHTAGIEPSAWEALREIPLLLKAPITTPQGGGFKSLNVTLRKTLGLYANVRPCVAYHPFVSTAHPGLDLVIVRENEEDLYAGIEHRQTDEVVQCLKLVSRPGCERIVRYAFEFARSQGRRKVTCMTKDNIMKMTDGLFRSVFEEVGAEYPDIERDHRIIDIGMARVACRPQDFDVIVTLNLYGDILSDVAAETAGSVGLAPSANIGPRAAMFEAIHGSAPDIAGQDIANPSGLLLAAVMMLQHAGRSADAERIHNAWLRTIEDGVHTADIFREGQGRTRVGTQAFADAVIARLGKEPETLTPVRYPSQPRTMKVEASPRPAQEKAVVGVDVFVQHRGTPEALAAQLPSTDRLSLQMITNRGVKVWPQGQPDTFCTDHWRCRYLASDPIGHADILALMHRLCQAEIDFVKTEHLCTFDGKPGYSLGQGQ